ncbi:hypothetical protein T439DRAFT_361121 [Meredithblackwellia eburnea MCA 4105]
MTGHRHSPHEGQKSVDTSDNISDSENDRLFQETLPATGPFHPVPRHTISDPEQLPKWIRFPLARKNEEYLIKMLSQLKIWKPFYPHGFKVYSFSVGKKLQHLNRFKGDDFCFVMNQTRVVLDGPHHYLPANLVCDPDLPFEWDGQRLERNWYIFISAPNSDNQSFRLHQLFLKPATSAAYTKLQSPQAKVDAGGQLGASHLIAQLTPIWENGRETCHPYFPAVGDEPMVFSPHSQEDRDEATAYYQREAKSKHAVKIVVKTVHQECLGPMWKGKGRFRVSVLKITYEMRGEPPTFEQRWYIKFLKYLNDHHEKYIEDVLKRMSLATELEEFQANCEMLRQRGHHGENVKCPITIHCSAGNGRTGLLAAMFSIERLCTKWKENSEKLEEQLSHFPFPTTSKALKGYNNRYEPHLFYTHLSYPIPLWGCDYNMLHLFGESSDWGLPFPNVLAWIVGGFRSQRDRIIQQLVQWQFILKFAAVRCGASPNDVDNWWPNYTCQEESAMVEKILEYLEQKKNNMVAEGDVDLMMFKPEDKYWITAV